MLSRIGVNCLQVRGNQSPPPLDGNTPNPVYFGRAKFLAR
jgi:hypothetical protein